MRSYKKFYGLAQSPFRKDISIPALLRYEQLEETESYLTFVVEEGSIGLVTGEVGVGKSTAVRAFLSTLDDRRYHVCYVGSSDATRSVLRRLAWSYGMRAAHLQGDLKDDVHQRIGDLWSEHEKRTVLVVDEAQAYGAKALQELRLLTNFLCDSVSPLALVLVGQPNLRSQLRTAVHAALDDRIMIRQHLAGLSKKETGEYIRAHLRAVGGPEDLFAPDAVAAIFDWSGGRPRRINKAGIQTIVKGGHKEVRAIDGDFVSLVLKDIDQE
jgi:type II secretory pathway predicted ATPase ExeA